MRGSAQHNRQQLQDELDKLKVRMQAVGGLTSAGVNIDTVRASLVPALRLAAEVFRAPVRIGTPTGIYGLTDQISTPAFATSVGLLKWGLDQEFEPAAARGGLPLSGIGSAVTNWLRNFLP